MARTSTTADLAKKMLVDGFTRQQVQDATGLAYSTVHYHAQKLGMSKPARDWAQVQAAHDAGMSHEAIMAKFGLASSDLRTARQRGYVTMPNSHDQKKQRREAVSVALNDLRNDVMALTIRVKKLETEFPC